MRKLTPVTTRSMTAASWSTWAVTAVLKGPALIHGKRSPAQVSPCQTRAKTAHAATKESATAGTATQCARRPMEPPRTALMTVPRSGKSGISHTTSGMVVLSGTKPASLYKMGPGVSRTGGRSQPFGGRLSARVKLERGDASPGDFHVLISGATAHADSSEAVPIHQYREAPDERRIAIRPCGQGQR